MKTQPLKEFRQALVPLHAPPQAITPTPDDVPEGVFMQPELPDTRVKESEAPPYALPQSVLPPKAAEPEAVELTPFQPIEPSSSLSPAVGALMLAANENSQKGNIDTAAASIDRALKIEPRNPALYYKLALIRLKQSKPLEAENLAKKSALLAAGDRQLKKHSWLLIAHAREMRRDFKGARDARAKAEGF
ncbi:MAG: tetratricopeptide repeat protein [Gammaproteobacteria bacterium]